MKNEFIRHVLSTIAYRFKKSVKSTEIEFGDFYAGKGSRTPNEIVNHIYRVLYATRIFVQEDRYEKRLAEPLALELEIERFNSELKKTDKLLAETELTVTYTKRLLQGPLADILTHIGQISMLRRLNDDPIAGEDFSTAPIKTGTV